MKLYDIARTLDDLAPIRYAEPWDNVGLLVGDPEAHVDRVVVTVDYTSSVAEEARSRRAQLVVAYHPPIFSAVKRAAHDALWVDAIRNNIALYSPHTALDVAAGGTNDFLADVCGMTQAARQPLRPLAGRLASDPEGVGLGRVGDVEATPLSSMIERVKAALGLDAVLVAGPAEASIRRVAVAAGAGGELLEDAIRARADLFVSGEIRHHDALLAVHRGMTVLATLHSNSERAAVRSLVERLRACLDGVDVVSSDRDADPFVIR